MKRFAWYCAAVCLSLLVVACTGPQGDLRGATPSGYVRPVAYPPPDKPAETVTIADLFEAPETYDGRLLEVSGTYYKRAVVVCSTRPQYSPARWALSDGEVRIAAGGVDQRLEDLPSGRIELTAVGRWLRWQGPVGCGRQAQVTEVWYLDVEEVVSPNPITIAAVGFDDGGVSIQTGPPETTGGYPGPGGTAESDDPQISATQILSGTEPSELPQPPGTPVLPPTPTSATNGGPNSTATPTTTAETGGSAGTPTTTSAAATPSPTTTNGSPAPTATASGGELETVAQEELPPDSIETVLLGPNEVHRWPFVITSTTFITVNVASQIELDVSITIRDPFGAVVAQQNSAQDGSPEVLSAVFLTTIGSYDILISSETGATGYYAILVLDQDSYTFVFNQTLDMGQDETTNLHENNDHFWFFYGAAGESVTIRVSPLDDADLFMRLFGPGGILLIDFHNETGEGEVEELLDFTLPETGFYSLLVGELAFGAATYTISLMSG